MGALCRGRIWDLVSFGSGSLGGDVSVQRDVPAKRALLVGPEEQVQESSKKVQPSSCWGGTGHKNAPGMSCVQLVWPPARPDCFRFRAVNKNSFSPSKRRDCGEPSTNIMTEMIR